MVCIWHPFFYLRLMSTSPHQDCVKSINHNHGFPCSLLNHFWSPSFCYHHQTGYNFSRRIWRNVIWTMLKLWFHEFIILFHLFRSPLISFQKSFSVFNTQPPFSLVLKLNSFLLDVTLKGILSSCLWCESSIFLSKFMNKFQLEIWKACFAHSKKSVSLVPLNNMSAISDFLRSPN